MRRSILLVTLLLGACENPLETRIKQLTAEVDAKIERERPEKERKNREHMQRVHIDHCMTKIRYTKSSGEECWANSDPESQKVYRRLLAIYRAADKLPDYPVYDVVVINKITLQNAR
jgi:hypothetical protein